nr:M20/M25/M40 family metallo-hydrolase [uncultured Methanobrevibacter sp.]
MIMLNDEDYELLKKLVSFKQSQTKQFAADFLKKLYEDITETEDYIIAKGDIPIVLIAHLDTVFEDDNYERNFIYRYFNGIMWHPSGAGFDDKAGIFIIFKILEEGYLPHVIFTTDEELGSIGAKRMVKDLIKHPFNDLKYLIELDRANEYDCVFYGCENQEFIRYVESFGFVRSFGTSSDINHICPVWNVAGVNLSVGYKDQHSANETLDVKIMFNTISKVKEMLDDAENIERYFKYSADIIK